MQGGVTSHPFPVAATGEKAQFDDRCNGTLESAGTIREKRHDALGRESRRRLACACRWAIAQPCRRLSDTAGHAGARVRARRSERRDGAHLRQAAGAGARPAGRDREPLRRGRQHRRRDGRARGARRLHAAARQLRHPRGQRRALQAHRLRSGEGLHPDHAGRRAGERAGDQSRTAGEDARRVHRARARPIPARSATPPAATAPRHISRASCCGRKPRSISCTCPTKAPGPPCRTSSPATCR